MWSECSWVIRIAESDCGSSPSDFIRLNVSRQEMPTSTRIRVRALATNAQFPRLPLASIETVTPMHAAYASLLWNREYFLGVSTLRGGLAPKSCNVRGTREGHKGRTLGCRYLG